MTLEDTRKQLHAVIMKIPEFSKSNRGEWLYNAKDDIGDKVKVQFKGNNFILMSGELEVKLISTPLKEVLAAEVDKCLRQFLVRHTNK